MCRRRFLPELEEMLMTTAAARIARTEASRKRRTTTPSTMKFWACGRSCRFVGLVLLSLMFLAVAEAGNPPIVRTKFGQIRGKWTKSARGLPIASFLGIPYADKPLGQLRFKNPQPWTQEWLGVRDATQDGPQCIQHDRKGNVFGSEDCLYLNVFAPLILNKRVSTKLPVLVFVHGGAFRTGSGDSRKYAPDYLLDQELILVTLNYRLNALGFFSTVSKASPGNYGLKDIVEALRWIQGNINFFGGDPKVVTLFGQSSGASAVHFLALTKKTEGLFDKLIMHSGSALNTWALHPQKNIRKASFEMARILNCLPSNIHDAEKINGTDSNRNQTESVSETEYEAKVDIDADGLQENAGKYYNGDYEDYAGENEEEMMACVRAVNVEKIMHVFSHYHIWMENPWCTFGPTLEEESEEAIVTTHPLNAIRKRLFRDIPWLIGVVKDEGLVKTLGAFVQTEARDEFIVRFEMLLPYVLEYHEILSNRSAFVDAVRSFYFDGNLTIPNVMRNITEMVGDALITWPTYEALKLQSEVMNAAVYFFLFSYDGTFTSSFASGIPVHYGVAHSDELNYLFPIFNNMFGDLMLHNTEDDVTMINIVTEMWSNFVRNGVPSAWLTPEWPNYRDHHEFMRFGTGKSSDITTERDFLPDRMEFWETLVPNVSIGLDELDPTSVGTTSSDEDDEGGSGTINYVSGPLVCLTIFLLSGAI